MTHRDVFVEAAGRRLHLIDWGGEGMPVLFSHAAGFLAALYWPVVKELKGSYHAYGLDLRGHGDSGPSPTDYAWSGFAEDVRDAVDGLGLKGILAVGHSVGGTATAVAAGMRPDLFTSIIIIEPVMGPPLGHPRHAEAAAASMHSATRAERRRNTFPSVEAFVESFSHRAPFNKWPRETLEIYAREGTRPLPDGTRELKCRSDIEAQLYAMRPANDPWPYLPKIACPTMVVRGDQGADFPDFAEPASTVIPNCRLEHVAEGGHLVPMERPDRIAALVDEFFAPYR